VAERIAAARRLRRDQFPTMVFFLFFFRLRRNQFRTMVFSCICLSKYMHIDTYTYVCVCIYVYIHTYIRTYIHVCMHTYRHTQHTHTQKHALSHIPLAPPLSHTRQYQYNIETVGDGLAANPYMLFFSLSFTFLQPKTTVGDELAANPYMRIFLFYFNFLFFTANNGGRRASS
jgi:hypothetical protein